MAYRVIMGILVVLLFVLAVALSEWRDAAFNQKITEAESRLREMQAEHARSMEIAEQAMKERELILKREKDKFCKAQSAMGANSDFCNVIIPDDLRLFFQENADRNDDGEIPAAGNAAR